MTNSSMYSRFISCLYDQAEPTGSLGRGTHYSVFRSIEWRDVDGTCRDRGRLHDFAVIWDEDHDTRVTGLVEQLHMHGLLWPIAFVGERKGTLTVLLWHDVDPTRERPDWFDVIKNLAESADDCDSWMVDFGRFHRDPANRQGLTEPASIINDYGDLVVAYLQAVDVLWRLGDKKLGLHRPMALSAGVSENQLDPPRK